MRHRGAEGSDTPAGQPSLPVGPARGFPPAPGQPDPVYAQNGFDAWAGDADPHGPQDGSREQRWDSAGPGGRWDAAPVGEWATDRDERWAAEYAQAPHPWGEGSGQWDAPYGHWDDNGDWHAPAGEDHGHDGPHGSGDRLADDHRDGYDRSDFAIGARDGASGWDPADYPDYGEPEPGEDDGGGRRIRRRRGGRGRGATGGQPAAAAAEAGTAGRAHGGPARRSARGASRPRAIGLAAACVVVLAAIAATAYALLGRPAHHPGAASASAPLTSAPKLPTPTASGTPAAAKLGKWGYITSRATDAAPLTVAELYPAQFMISGSSFARTTDRADTNCDQGLFGAQLQNAAKVYACSQVVRASYVSSDQTMMGTIGVVNLSGANDAAKAGGTSGPNDFVTPLNGPTAPTKSLSKGTGVVQAEFKGHYLILIWAEFTTLEAPSTAAQQVQLEQFSSGLISGSANIALSYRMVHGHPQAVGTGG